MEILRIPGEFTGANPHKRQPIPVGFVHIRLNFENKGGKIRVKGINDTAVRRPGQRRRGQLQEGLQEGLNAEVRQGGAEEHRRQLAVFHGLGIHFPSGGQKLHIVDQLPGFLLAAQKLRNLRIVQIDFQLIGS